MVVGAVGSANLHLGFVRQPCGHVFDCAADRVAAVKRALRPAQHFDPLDIIDVENSGLRAIEIDIVHIQTDARLEAGDRVLLSHAADEGGQRRIRTAADFQRQVRYDLGNFGQFLGAAAFQGFPADGRYCDGNIDQPLFPAPRSYDDDAVFCYRIFRCLSGIVDRLVGDDLCRSRGRQPSEACYTSQKRADSAVR